LCVLCIEAVHAVTGFVREGEHIVEGAIPVHEHHWWSTISSPAIGAGRFPLVLVHVYPAAFEALPQVIHVLFAEGTNPIQHDIDRLLEGIFLLAFRRQWNTEVV